MADNKVKITIETDAGRSEQVLNGVKNSLQGVEKQYKSTAKESQSFSVSNGKSLASVAASLKSLGIAYTAAKSAKEAFFLSKDASRYNEMALYAKNAADSIGINFDRMVEASKRGAKGMTSNINIMQANLRALKLGLNASADEIGRLWEIANATGDELGQSIEQTFDQITNAIVTGNSRSLISLGVLSDNFKKASNSAEMLEKRGDLLKTVLEELGKKADTLNKYGDTGYDKYQKLDTAFQNLKTTVGQQLTPAFETIVTWLTKIIEKGDQALQTLGKLPLMGVRTEANNPYADFTNEQLQASLERNKKLKSKYYLTSSTRIGEEFGGNAPSNAYSYKSDEDDAKYRKAAENVKLIEAELKKRNDLEKKRLEIIEKTNQKNAENAFKLKDQNEQLSGIFASTTGIYLNFKKIGDNAKEAGEKAEKAAQKAREEYEKFVSAVESGTKKAFGVANMELEEFVSLSYQIGMSTLGFNAKVDEQAAEIYKLNAAFNEMVENEEKLTDVQIALENISSISFDNLAKAGRNIDDISKAASQLWVGAAMGAANQATGVLDITKGIKPPEETAKKGWAAIKGQVIEGFSEAVTSGIINSNLGDALRGAISSIAASKAQSYGSNLLSGLFGNKGVNVAGALSGFVGSIAVSAIANNWKKWFGDKNKQESIAKNKNTMEAASNAYFSTYSAMLNPYMTNEMYNDLLGARLDYQMTSLTVSNKGKSRGGFAGLAGGKDYRDTTPKSTYEMINSINAVVEKVDEYNKEKEKELDLLSAQGKDYQVLTSQIEALTDTMDRIKYMSGVYTDSWTGYGNMKGKYDYSIDLSDSIQDLKKAYYEALREYGEETGARNQQKASTFMSLFPYLDNYDMGSTSLFAGMGQRRMGQFVMNYPKYKTIENNDVTSSAYNYVRGVQEDFLNRNATASMLEMIKQAGKEQFNLAELQYTDGGSKYMEAYLNVLERQKEAAELVMQEQEQIYRDMTKTFEEQAAALETYQQAQEQYYNSKLEILAQEKAKEEQLKKEEQQAKLRSADRMEALLGFTGEMAKRGDNNIYILEGSDQIGALREMEKYIDDPEALAFVQRLITAALNKNKYGKIG